MILDKLQPSGKGFHGSSAAKNYRALPGGLDLPWSSLLGAEDAATDAWTWLGATSITGRATKL